MIYLFELVDKKVNKMYRPLVSIITASYNYGEYIKETINSVICQSYDNWELIIVDDGSRDNSVEIIQDYSLKDTRIKLYTHPDNKNLGLAETLKLGISKATGEWIIFLESDDSIKPEYIEKKLEIIKNYPDVKFIFNDTNCFGDKSRIEYMEDYFQKQKKVIKTHANPGDFLTCFENFNVIPTFSTVMVKKEILKNIDFNSPLKKFLDYYIWAQLAADNKFFYIDEKLTNWRMHANSYISANCCKQDKVFFDLKILDIICSRHFRLKYLFKYLNLHRKKIFRLIIPEHKVLLFGKWYNYSNIMNISKIDF